MEIPLFVDDHVPCLDTEQDRMEESHWLMAMAHENEARMPGDDGEEPRPQRKVYYRAFPDHPPPQGDALLFVHFGMVPEAAIARFRTLSY